MKTTRHFTRWGGVYNSSLKLIFTALLSFTLILSFNACSDGDDNGNQNPAPSPTTVTTESVTTSGTVSSSTVTVGATTTVKTSADGKSYYEFTESTSVSANISSRTVTVDDTKGGTWKYFENEALKYTGTYKGDISEFSEVLQDNTTSEGLKLELTVTEVVRNGTLVEVSSTTEESTFSFEVKADTAATGFKFEATIPAVTASVEEGKDAPSVAISVPTASELAGKIFKSIVNDAIYYYSFDANGANVTPWYLGTIEQDAASYNAETGAVEIEYSGTKSVRNYILKKGSDYILLNPHVYKLPRVSGSGLNSTFSAKENAFTEGTRSRDTTRMIVAKNDGTFTGSIKDVMTTGTTTELLTQTTMSGSYTNVKGEITVRGQSVYENSKLASPQTEDFEYKCFYDGTNFWLIQDESGYFTLTEETALPDTTPHSVTVSDYDTEKGTLIVNPPYGSELSAIVQNQMVSVSINLASHSDSTKIYDIADFSVVDAENNKLPVQLDFSDSYYGSYYGSFVMPASNVTVSLTFKEVNLHDVNYSSVAGGSAYPNKSSYAAGRTVTGTVSINTDYIFESLKIQNANSEEVNLASLGFKWTTPQTSDGDSVKRFAFTMPDYDVTLVPVFTAMTTYTITQDESGKNSDNYATLSVDDSASEGRTVGISVYVSDGMYGYDVDTVTVTKSDNSTVAVSEDSSSSAYTRKYSFVMPASNVTVKVTYKPIDFDINLSNVTSGGTFEAPGTAKKGESVIITVSPESGYQLDTIEVSNGMEESFYKKTYITKMVKSGKEYTFTMPTNNVLISVTFKNATTAETKDVPNAVGDVVLSDGKAISKENVSSMSDEQKDKAVAVIFYAGSSSDVLGERTLGVGLVNSHVDGTVLQWSPTDATGFNKKFASIVCTPSVSSNWGGAKIGNGTNQTKPEDVTFTGDTDGSNNWAVIQSEDSTGSDNAAVNYPAFNYANTYGSTVGITGTYATGWYLPSVAELENLYLAKETVNTVLSQLGGIPLNDGTTGETSYWSSSQAEKFGNEEMTDYQTRNYIFVYSVVMQNGNIYTDFNPASVSSQRPEKGKSNFYSVCAIRSF